MGQKRTSKVRCLLCPKECELREGERGDCRVRINLYGKLQTLVHGTAVAANIDPIEKKPIYHMIPGTGAFSIATAGCNLHCKFCQNWQISQNEPEDSSNISLPPEAVVHHALRNGCRSIAYTYSEPIIFYEYMLDTARLAREHGLKNLMITAGFINPKPLRELCSVMDGANVDLKAFTQEYYRDVCFAELGPVMRCLEIMQEAGIWVEITNLVVPTLNDNMHTIRKMCSWIRDNLGSDTIVHFSRFFPMYKLTNLPPTPVKTLEQARDTAMEMGLRFVYAGNVPGHPGESTYCPRCGQVLIQRYSFWIAKNNLISGKCRFCGESIPGVWL
jgi:pyruvate formate lyase activating enzyme